jgi:hypothetical protein
MTSPVAVQDLHPSEAAFVAAMQDLGFGRFEFLRIRDGEFVLQPWPVVVRDVKFASAVHTGRAVDSHSGLCQQVVELFAYVRDVDDGEIRSLEVRHGLPFSMEVELSGGRRG